MGKVIRDTATSDISAEEQRNAVRIKRKKCKRSLTELHRRLLKSKRNKETKIDGKLDKTRNSKKVSNRILPRPVAGIYRNGAAGKIIRRSETNVPLNDINNARLQGDVYKLLNACDPGSECIAVENGTKENLIDPLLDSSVKNILQPTPPGDEYLSPILGKVDGKRRYPRNGSMENLNPSKITYFPKQTVENKKDVDFEEFQSCALEKYEELCNTVSAENFEEQNFSQFGTDPLIATKKKLRNMYAESFRNQCLRDLIKRGKILNETATSSCAKTSLSSEVEYSPSSYFQDSDLVSVIVEDPKEPEHQIRNRRNKRESSLPENQNIFIIPKTNFDLHSRKDNIPTSHLLFDVSLLNTSNVEVENIKPQLSRITSSLKDSSTDVPIQTSLEVNHSNGSQCKRNNVKYFETVVSPHVNKIERLNETSNSPLFMSTEAQLPNNFISKKYLMRRKNQYIQAAHRLKHGAKGHPGKCNLKVSQELKVKNLKHIPTILRRCNNDIINDTKGISLFNQSILVNKHPKEVPLNTASKQNAFFFPRCLETELNTRKLETTDTVTVSNASASSDFNVQTCVMGSPSLSKDEIFFLNSACSQMVNSKQQPHNLNMNEVFLNKKRIHPPVQKTVMFTKKDSRNISHCSDLHNLITDRTADNSNIYTMNKNVFTKQNKSTNNACAVHRHHRRPSANCYRSIRCPECVGSSHYCNQESSMSKIQNAEVPQKPVVCEKVMLKEVPQHSKPESNQKCHNDEHICYVIVDQRSDSNNAQEYPNDNISHQNEKLKPLQNRHFCQNDVPDIGILKGVQNLQIMPMEEQLQTNFSSNQCTRKNAVLLEEQPIKYMAVEKNSRTQKIPIYVQSSKHVTSVDNVEIVNPNVNYRVVPYPQESAQKVILVPTCEQNKVVYTNQQKFAHSNVSSIEECSHPRKMILYRPEFQSNLCCVKDPSNVCEVHVPKKNLVEIRNTEHDAIVNNLQQVEKVKLARCDTIKWDDLLYQSSHEHPHMNNTFLRNHTVLYRK